MQEASLYEHLVGVLCFFIRQHSFRSKYFTLSEGLHSRVGQLLSCPQKHLQLTALKWFRTCLFLHDEFHNRQIIQHGLLEPALAIVEETMPRDNLLNSACLELFEFIIAHAAKPILIHIVETYRERLLAITYVDTFHRFVHRYDQMQSGYNLSVEDSSFATQGTDTPNRGIINGGQRWNQGLKTDDPDQDAYFDTSDGEDEEEASLPEAATAHPLLNGAGPARPLVAYPDDDEDAMDALSASPSDHIANEEVNVPEPEQEVDTPEPRRGRDRTPVGKSKSPPERPSEKRRREEDEDDDLDRIAGSATPSKRRSSFGPQNQSSKGDTTPDASPKNNGPTLRRRGSLRNKENIGSGKAPSMGAISISLRSGAGSQDGDG